MVAPSRALRRVIFDTLVTLVLSPILLAQAISLRKRALRLPEASGPRSATQGTGAPLKILIIGDSSAAGVGAQSQNEAFAGQLSAALAPRHTVQWHLIASTGATSSTTLSHLQGEVLKQADVVIIVLGVNDVTRGGPMARWLRIHAVLRTLLRNQTGARRLYISEVPPLGAFPLLPNPLRWVIGRRAIRFDAALRTALAMEPDTTYVLLPRTLNVSDMAEDGFHPGPAIYSQWAKEMARQIISDGP
jgi:lysophospholipase L1-like esterase